MTDLDATRIGEHRVTIVAFDGILADTIPLRATALAEAIVLECASLGIAVHAHDILPLLREWLPGRTFSEAISVAIEQLPALQQKQIRHDLTLHDLVALRAQRAWSARASQGVPLRDGILSRLQAAVSRGLRIVLRSDSQRQEVEPVLRLAGLEDSTLFVRCADDLPRTPGASMLQASYEAIAARLERQRVSRAQRDAVEANNRTANFARGFAATSGLTF